jgi:hypothetical protein
MFRNKHPRTLDQKLSLWSPECQDAKRFRLELLAGYKRWVRDFVNQEWLAYYVSFMFNQLPGTQASVFRQMKADIVRVYCRLPTQFSRNPRSPAGAKLLPRMILFPDLPVYKHEKKSIRDVSINNGLHYGGIALTPPVSRFQSTLDAHFAQDHPNCIGEKLARIHVTPITDNPGFVVDYAAKSLKRGWVSEKDIVILPRAITELPSN